VGVAGLRREVGVRTMLIVGAKRSTYPLPAASAPSAVPYRRARSGSQAAARLTAFGKAVTWVVACPTPFGPSMNASGGTPSRGTPAAPLAMRASFSSAVIASRSACARAAGLRCGFAQGGRRASASAPVSSATPARGRAALPLLRGITPALLRPPGRAVQRRRSEEPAAEDERHEHDDVRPCDPGPGMANSVSPRSSAGGTLSLARK